MGNPSEQKVESARFRTLSTQVWRRGWDSNPCGIAPKLISSQPRYDHFDTSPCLSQHLTPEKHLGFWGELMGRTYMIFGFRSLRKPSRIKGSGVRRVHKGDTISSADPSTTWVPLPIQLTGGDMPTAWHIIAENCPPVNCRINSDVKPAPLKSGADH